MGKKHECIEFDSDGEVESNSGLSTEYSEESEYFTDSQNALSQDEQLDASMSVSNSGSDTESLNSYSESPEHSRESESDADSGKIYYSSSEEENDNIIESQHVQDNVFTLLKQFYPENLSPLEGLAYCIEHQDSITNIFRDTNVRNKLCLLLIQTWLSTECDAITKAIPHLLKALLKLSMDRKKPKFTRFLLKRSFECLLRLNHLFIPHFQSLFDQVLQFWTIAQSNKESYMLLFELVRQYCRNIYDFFFTKSKMKKEIYSWKTCHSSRFFAECIVLGKDSKLNLLVFPFVQGTLTLLSQPFNFHLAPFRAHLIKSLLRLDTVVLELNNIILSALSSLMDVKVIPNPKAFKPFELASTYRLDEACIGNVAACFEIYEQLLHEQMLSLGMLSTFHEVTLLLRHHLKKKTSSIPAAYLLKKSNKKTALSHPMFIGIQRLENYVKILDGHAQLTMSLRESIAMLPNEQSKLTLRDSRKIGLKKSPLYKYTPIPQ